MKSDAQVKNKAHDINTLDFRWYLAGQGTWFFHFGMQMVLLPIMAALILKGSSVEVAITQAALAVPMLIFLLPGGIMADRYNCRTLLIYFHTIALFIPFMLSVVVWMDRLSLSWLIFYGLLMGTVSAFILPTRDAALNRIARQDIPRGIAIALGVQFTAQLTGIVMAGSGQIFPLAALLTGQAVILAFGAYAVWRLPSMPSLNNVDANSPGILSMVRDTLAALKKAPNLYATMIIMCGVGVFYVGSFQVLLPLRIRDFYDRGIVDYTLFTVCFWGGTIVMSVYLARVGMGRLHERNLMVSTSIGAVILASFALPLPFYMACVMCFFWGLGAGVAISSSRTIIQTGAPKKSLAQFLAIFNLAFMGGMPLGAMISGLSINFWGQEVTALICAGGMLTLLTTIAIQKKIKKYA